MSEEYDLLLRGVLIDPADDLPRLVLADWLEESGDGVRAAYIRDACELATLVRSDPRHDFGACPAARGRASCAACKVERRVRGEEYRNWLEFAGAARSAVPVGRPYYQNLIFSRGFVSGVTLSLAELFGGPCKDHGCRGGHLVGAWQAGDRCPSCEGTGRTPGLAAALFAAHPITAVTLSAVTPFRATHPMQFGSTGGYLFFGESHHEARYLAGSVLPDPLLQKVCGLSGGGALADRDEASFTTGETASEVLSAVLVAEGRSLVGLPPLPPPAWRN